MITIGSSSSVSLSSLSEFASAHAKTVGIVAAVGVVALGVFWVLRNTDSPKVPLKPVAKPPVTKPASELPGVAPDWLSADQYAYLAPIFKGTKFNLSIMRPIESSESGNTPDEPTWFRSKKAGLLEFVVPVHSSVSGCAPVDGTISLQQVAGQAKLFAPSIKLELFASLLRGETVVQSGVTRCLRV